jgi:hypothetical protein
MEPLVVVELEDIVVMVELADMQDHVVELGVKLLAVLLELVVVVVVVELLLDTNVLMDH